MFQGFQDDIMLVAGNVLHTMKEAKRKDNWKKLFISLEKGILCVYKNTKVGCFYILYCMCYVPEYDAMQHTV